MDGLVAACDAADTMYRHGHAPAYLADAETYAPDIMAMTAGIERGIADTDLPDHEAERYLSAVRAARAEVADAVPDDTYDRLRQGEFTLQEQLAVRYRRWHPRALLRKHDNALSIGEGETDLTPEEARQEYGSGVPMNGMRIGFREMRKEQEEENALLGDPADIDWAERD